MSAPVRMGDRKARVPAAPHWRQELARLDSARAAAFAVEVEVGILVDGHGDLLVEHGREDLVTVAQDLDRVSLRGRDAEHPFAPTPKGRDALRDIWGW